MLSSAQSEFDHFFRMVIHLPNEQNERIARLSTNTDENIVSHRVIASLHLQTDMYTEEAIRLGPLATNSYKPERKITIELNIVGNPTKYTTTFAVLDEEYSDQFDVLLGLKTIRKIGFYKKNCEIW